MPDDASEAARGGKQKLTALASSAVVHMGTRAEVRNETVLHCFSNLWSPHGTRSQGLRNPYESGAPRFNASSDVVLDVFEDFGNSKTKTEYGPPNCVSPAPLTSIAVFVGPVPRVPLGRGPIDVRRWLILRRSCDILDRLGGADVVG